jgi:chitinase
VDVTVVSPGGTSLTSSSDAFTFYGQPSVTGVSPNSGPISGGYYVTVTGTNFVGTTGVKDGDTPTAFQVVDNSTLSVYMIPGETAGDSTDIVVTSPGGTSPTTSADQFTYNASGGCTGACVSIGDASILEGDAGTRTLSFPVTLSQPSNTTVTVDYAVTDGTATGGTTRAQGVDYQTKTGTLTFAVNTATGVTPVEKWVTVPVYGDTVPEPDETLSVTLANVSGNYNLGRTVGTGTILNDDGVATGITAGIGDASIVVAASGQQSLKLPVTLSNVTTTVTMSYTVTPTIGTLYSANKAGGGDYGGKTSGTLTFAAGKVSNTISIPIWPNANPTGTAGFTVTLSNPTGPITVVRDTGTGSILGG